MSQNVRAGLIPEPILKDILSAPNNTWHCEVLAKIAGKRCDSFDSCAECIDYTLNWFYADDVVSRDVQEEVKENE